MTIKSLRNKHSSLVYKKYHYQINKNQLKISFKFLLKPNITFTPQLIIENINQGKLEKIPKPILENLIFHLGLAELPSYWKCACPNTIKIEAGSLNSDQITWWKSLFKHGLGEFYYINKIDFTEKQFLNIEALPQEEKLQNIDSPSDSHFQKPYLLPIGGGKDSGLALSLFDQHQLNYGCMVLHPASPATSALIQASRSQETINVKRTIDPILLKLNNQGYLNGHTPFSAYLAFLSTLVAYVFGYQQALIANESSANQANLEYKDLKINHQYSKSFNFEQKFRSYSQDYLHTSKKQAEYLSLLRPLNELQISQLFSQHSKFLPIFKSCNIGQKQNQWCHRCPKCLFVYMMLYPFVDKATLTNQIFDHDLYSDGELFATASSLLGLGDHKPLECVGTELEAIAACLMAIENHEKQDQELPILLKRIKNEVLNKFDPEEIGDLPYKMLSSWDYNNFLDRKLGQIIKSALKN